MFSMGLILAIMGVLFLYAGFDQFGAALVIRSVLVVAGLLMVGAGLNLFFQLESTIITRIRRALQKPLWNDAYPLQKISMLFSTPRGGQSSRAHPSRRREL